MKQSGPRKSAYVLLLDDDAITEPEAILRALQFSDYATRPVLVGGGMLHLDNRTVLYSSGERFDASSAMPAPATGTHYNHDFAVDPLRILLNCIRESILTSTAGGYASSPTEVLKKLVFPCRFSLNMTMWNSACAPKKTTFRLYVFPVSPYGTSMA